MDQLFSDVLRYIMTFIDTKTLLVLHVISHKFADLSRSNLESLLRQRLTHISRLNLKNYSLKCLINLTRFPFNRNRINASGSHSIILDDDGQIYTFGDNYYGQLGLGDCYHRNTPTLINDIYNIITISAGGGHSMILNYDKQIYAFGSN